LPPTGSVREQRPFLDWVLRGEFPSFNGTTALSDSLCPSRRASLPSLGDTLRCACRFAPVGPERRPRAWGSAPGPHGREVVRMEAVQGLPGFWTTLVQLRPVLRPRPERTPLARTVCRCCPRAVKNEGSQRVILSGLNRTALLLAVYASSRPLRHPDARLASGCWLGFTAWDWLPTEFQ